MTSPLTVVDKKITFPTPLKQARIINRPNRFIVYADIDGKVVKCHCPSTGRIGGYVLDNLPCLLSGPHDLSKRTTEYTVEAFAVQEVDTPGFQWIGINQTAANRYVEAALEAGLLRAAFPSISLLEKERKLGTSRIDFRINGDTYVEVKMPLTIIEVDAPSLTPKDFKPKIGIDRMLNQLEDLTTALDAGEKALMISCFAYDMPDFTTPGATSRRKFGPLPAMVKAQQAGLERWQLNFSFHPTHLEVAKFFKLPIRT